MADAKPIPDGYPQVTPYLAVDDAAAAIEFYARVFGAEERVRMGGPEGSVMHAELQLGDSLIMLSDPFPGMNVKPPKELGGTPVTVSVYVEDVDSVFNAAVEAGAREERAVREQFYRDRT